MIIACPHEAAAGGQWYLNALANRKNRFPVQPGQFMSGHERTAYVHGASNELRFLLRNLKALKGCEGVSSLDFYV
ncbi:MAG TPA: hypothetical protein DCP92_25275 [Nitrospiraceae bacterium]|nr:hypothetical protein [Nitrospiraceae bacterium]